MSINAGDTILASDMPSDSIDKESFLSGRIIANLPGVTSGTLLDINVIKNNINTYYNSTEKYYSKKPNVNAYMSNKITNYVQKVYSQLIYDMNHIFANNRVNFQCINCSIHCYKSCNKECYVSCSNDKCKDGCSGASGGCSRHCEGNCSGCSGACWSSCDVTCSGCDRNCWNSCEANCGEENCNTMCKSSCSDSSRIGALDVYSDTESKWDDPT